MSKGTVSLAVLAADCKQCAAPRAMWSRRWGLLEDDWASPMCQCGALLSVAGVRLWAGRWVAGSGNCRTLPGRSQGCAGAVREARLSVLLSEGDTVSLNLVIILCVEGGLY